jgi:hypothetical protein
VALASSEITSSPRNKPAPHTGAQPRKALMPHARDAYTLAVPKSEALHVHRTCIMRLLPTREIGGPFLHEGLGRLPKILRQM